MSAKSSRPPKITWIDNLAIQAKLILRLMGDRRISPLLKLMPFLAVLYLFFPDPVLGPVEDFLILWIAITLFKELSPPEVVEEVLKEFREVIPGEWEEVQPEEDILEGEFYSVDTASATHNNGHKAEHEH